MKVLLTSALIFAALLKPVFGAEMKVAFIDIQRALNESEAGQKAKKRFKEQLDRLQKDLERQKDQVDALKDQLAKKGLVMKEEERRNLEQDYQRKLREFERAYEDSQAELQQRDAELTRELIEEIQGVIQGIGRKEGYTLIFEQSGSGLLYGDSSLDITEDVIKAYDKSK
jgi:outer membrane protein